jgi:hypothetical protein
MDIEAVGDGDREPKVVETVWNAPETVDDDEVSKKARN